MNVTPSLDAKTALALTLVSDPDGKLATKLYPRIKSSRLSGARWDGTLTDFDPAKGEVQFAGPKTKGLPKSLPVAKDARIHQMYGQVSMQQIALHQVVKMVHATVLISSHDQQVTHVLVETPAVRATVKALDAERGTLTVEMDGKRKVFALRRDIKVMDGTRVRRLTDLQADAAVHLVLSLDQQQLLAIDLRQDAEVGPPGLLIFLDHPLRKRGRKLLEAKASRA